MHEFAACPWDGDVVTSWHGASNSGEMFDPRTIKGDRDKINVALHNLLGNALKYTPAGGQVTVNVSIEKNVLGVEFIDTGFGISEEDQKRIFDKFYRAKDPRIGKIVGTGLGLTLAREVMRLHGGDITVDSQLDKGSTFTLTLPIAVEAV